MVFAATLGVVSTVLLALTWRSRGEGNVNTSQGFRTFQIKFVGVYLIMMAADWMQGPYVYALYEHYAFDMETIAMLFIAGFGSSMVFGTFAGSLADKYGRKLTCIMYGVTYGLSCMTKHSNQFEVLLLGRVLGGIATSILFSAFESWMVSEHTRNGFQESWMSHTFSYMTMGNGLVAIAAGLLAQTAVDMSGSPVAPFDVSLCFLILGSAVVYFQWTENYGDVQSGMGDGVKLALKQIAEDRKVFLLGALQSMFEGAMYVFVFMWTPTLQRSKEVAVPHGVVFAAFMVCSSIGGALFSILVRKTAVENFMPAVYAVAALAMLVPAMTIDTSLCFYAFLVFEVCVGMFWPGMGTLRSKYVPENSRATIMNIFRIPLNLLVCLALRHVHNLEPPTVFVFCAGMHTCCFLAQAMLAAAIKADGAASVGGTDATDIQLAKV